jgi:hypothetical protein
MAGGNKQRAPGTMIVLLRPVVRFVFRHRSAIAALVVIGACCYGGLWIWNRVDDDVRQRAEYTLAPHEIQITPPPPWIRADVKSEALRAASLDEAFSILDERLAERLAGAFSLHPWVARVDRVAKEYPPRLVVDLVYRRPVAMVEVPGGLFAVDEQAVLLPSDDFATADARQYLRIAGIDSQPLGPVGTAWGDPSVLEGVRIARALEGVWRELRLYSIRRVAAASSETATVQSQFELVTQSGVAIPWGRAPGSESANEPPVAEKIARLKTYATDYGLDESARRNDLDLRVRGGTRTAGLESKR